MVGGMKYLLGQTVSFINIADLKLVSALETMNYHEVETEVMGEERDHLVRKSYLDLRIITLLPLLLPCLCLKGNLRREEICDGGNLCLYLHQ